MNSPDCGRPFPLTVPQGLLCAAVQSHDPVQASAAVDQLIEQMGIDAAFAWGQINDVAAILGHPRHHTAIDVATSAKPLVRFQLAHQALTERISEYLQELDQVAAALHSRGIRVVALKNAGIARGLYRCPGCSPMGDVDLLIAPSHFRAAHAELLELGYEFKFRSPLESNDLGHAEASGGGEYHRRLPSGETLWLELQWRPVAGRWIRPDQEPLADELLSRSLEIEGTRARILAPEDNLLQVALHTAKHTYVRAPGFRLHTDIDRILGSAAIDWDLFVYRALTAQVRTAVYFSLALARELLGTPVPLEALAALRPPKWKVERIRSWLWQAGLFEPDAPKFSRHRFLLFNALLYDGVGGLSRAVFPPPAWMRNRYNCSLFAVPYYYGRRLVDLAWRRART